MTDTAWLRRARTPILVYLVSLMAYAAASGTRLRKHSAYNHYVYLADSWLHGKLDLGRKKPPNENDWARIDTLHLEDGRTVRGVFLKGGVADHFRTLKGEVLTVPEETIAKREHTYYVSFPPLPSVLMLPFVAVFGLAFNDVIFTVVLAAFNPLLAYLLLRRLRPWSERGEVDNLWLTGMFAFGTVAFYASVLGEVWYTAHVVGLLLTWAYLFFALEARHPVLAGAAIGLGFVTRTPLLFAFPLLLFELVRCRPTWRARLRGAIAFAAPVAAIGLAMAAMNLARFESPFEFGHTYLNVRWAERIQRWGLFNYHFLGRNLACAFALLPRIYAKAPFVKVSWHGMSLLLTTPALLYLLWPRTKGPLHRALWATVAAVAIPSFLYQNSGWIQFGYRFSLDYTPMLIALWALGGRRLTFAARALILFGVVVNLFGALTFGRAWGYYYDGLFPVE
jgi:hypothetical protein